MYTPLCRLRNSKLPSAATATVQAVEAQSSAAASEEEERHAPLSELICIWMPVMAWEPLWFSTTPAILKPVTTKSVFTFTLPNPTCR